MNKHLWLMRHAKSDWGDENLSDFDRPLAARGQRDAPRMAVWLATQGNAPELIISSPAERARATASVVATELELAGKELVFDEAIYGASVQSLLYALEAHCGDYSSILLVGHNPGLEELLMYLTGGQLPDADNHKLMPTAAIAHLHCEHAFTELAHNSARCDLLQRPRQLD